jgi:protein TonB
VKTRPFFFCGSIAGVSVRGVHNSKQISTLEDAMFRETMFADSLLETSWAQRSRRSWTTLSSFGLEALVIGLLLLLPVLKTAGLPSARTVSTPISLGRRAPEPLAPAPQSWGASTAQASIAPARFMQPSRIPTVIRTGPDDSTPQLPSGPGAGIQGTDFPPGPGDGLSIASVINGSRPMLPAPPPSISRAIRTSSILEGNLIRRVEPVYPPLARSARIQGRVVLVAVISKAGTIENLHALSGHPMLVPAAVDAVSQWRYRPYILNSEAIEVETQITVNFSLSGN